MDSVPEDNMHDETAPSPDEGRTETGVATPRAVPGMPFPWETYLRSFFLLVVIGMVGMLAWRPGILRLSLLYSLTSPTHGDSLAWRGDEDPLPPPPEIKRVAPPDEWRLGPAYSVDSTDERPAVREDMAAAGSLTGNRWGRAFENPWRWYDDADAPKRRASDLQAALPPQKPESPFRAGDIAAWPAAPAPGQTQGATPSRTAPNSAPSALSALPPLPPLPGPGTPGQTGSLAPLQPIAPSPGVTADGATHPFSLPPLPAANGAARTETQASPTTPSSSVPPLAPLPSLPATTSAEPSSAPKAAQSGDAGEVDWKNREITRPIPGAYLTVYPKLKFIGLCVPGQGYIRKYNQVGVPADPANPKMEARDGRVPYGKYYIADRHRDADGPRLFISWPSPEDARRIGLDPGRIAQVDHAWRSQSLPPQDTAAGGGVGFNGLRNWVETTEGGFTLEAPHMEEIFTALPDKAWVFIQQ